VGAGSRSPQRRAPCGRDFSNHRRVGRRRPGAAGGPPAGYPVIASSGNATKSAPPAGSLVGVEDARRVALQSPTTRFSWAATTRRRGTRSRIERPGRGRPWTSATPGSVSTVAALRHPRSRRHWSAAPTPRWRAACSPGSSRPTPPWRLRSSTSRRFARADRDRVRVPTRSRTRWSATPSSSRRWGTLDGPSPTRPRRIRRPCGAGSAASCCASPPPTCSGSPTSRRSVAASLRWPTRASPSRSRSWRRPCRWPSWGWASSAGGS